MKIRQGRKNGHNLYLQFGDEPSDRDISIGYVKYPELAQWIVDAVDLSGGAYRHLEEIVDNGLGRNRG